MNAIRCLSIDFHYCDLINIIDFAESSESHSSVYKILDFLMDILKLFLKRHVIIYNIKGVKMKAGVVILNFLMILRIIFANIEIFKF